MKLILFFLFFPFYGLAQVMVSGTVVEETTGKAIAYATIGLVKQNTGTTANEQGEFSIQAKQAEEDSIIISCVGYNTRRLLVKDLRNRVVIGLSIQPKRLKPVVVKNKWNYIEAGKYTKLLNSYLTTNGFQSQVAKKMTAPVANAHLQAIHIRISTNRGKSMFRVHVFDYDSLTQGPGEELTDSAILVKAGKSLVSVDMKPYQVMLPGQLFFVSIEWLFIPYNEYLVTRNFEGRRLEMPHYDPLIRYTERATSASEIWHLFNNGKWHSPKFKEDRSLAISATVKY